MRSGRMRPAVLAALALTLALLLAGCGSEKSDEGVKLAAKSQAHASEQVNADDVLPPLEEVEEVLVAEAETEPEPEPEPAAEVGEEPVTQDLPEPSDDDFVRVKDYIPDIVVDLKYATENNFTKTVIYDFRDAYLRYGTVVKLAKVQQELKEQGYGLKIWDAFRPVSAQYKLWEIVPDPTYVANPNKGYSSHSRGNTVDITLVDSSGAEREMPTGFDDFSDKADRDYDDIGKTATSNARLLEDIMEDNGFKPYFGEWWHFSDYDSYDLDESFEPEN